MIPSFHFGARMPSDKPSFTEEAYVLLHPTERISRSYRVSWYFDRLYKKIQVQRNINRDRSIQVVSLVGSDGEPVDEILLGPQTKAWYLGESYSLVFAVDMNASMASVAGDTILLDDVYKMLEMCLESLVQPLFIPGLEQQIVPSLCVTVLACTHDCSRPSKHKSLHVVTEGISVTLENVKEVICHVLKELRALERSQMTRPGTSLLTRGSPSSQNMLESMLKSGVLGMQLLPRTSIKGIVVLTNGVTGFNSSSSMHSTISEMRTNNISCWIFRAGSHDVMDWGYGQVPECETMSFVARACNGNVTFIRDFFADKRPDKLKLLQKSLLLNSFQKEADLALCRNESDLTRKFIRIHREEYSRSTIEGSLSSVLGCRIREGFLVTNLKCERDLLEINFCLPLQTDVSVHYTIVVSWPVQAQSVLSISVSYEAPRAFVCEFTSEVPHQNYTPYRASAIKKLKQFLHNLRQADRLLGQLLGFSANTPFSKVPSRNKDGMPVFYMAPNQTVPVPSVSVSSSGDKERTQDENAFVNFWRPVCTLDIIYWKKWMHSHKINLILSPDAYLPQQALQPAGNGKFLTLQCRFATTKLMEYLKKWSSFILLENHTFVKFLPRDDAPTHFCLVRVVQKPPTLVLHIGCLEGIPHALFLQVIESLKSEIQGLVAVSVVKSSTKRIEKTTPAVEGFLKPLQKVMVWYAALPKRLALSYEDDDLQLNLQYLSCERRVWSLPSQVEKHDIADALLRKHCAEGFRISSCQNGMITLALQLTLKQSGTEIPYFALLQYVLFLNMDKTRDSTVLSSEVWIEPQYGEIVKPRLYLSGSGPCTTKDLPDKLMSDEVSTLSSVVSFYQLLSCCSNKSEPKRPSLYVSHPDLFPVTVPLRLSSLLPHSRAVGLVLPAFAGASDNAAFGESVNDFLKQNVHLSMNDMFDISLMSIPMGSVLQERLNAGGGQLSGLQEYFTTFPVYWHAWVMRDQKDLYMVLLPASFRSVGNESSSHVVAVVLQCRLRSLLLPYPTESSGEKQGHDVELVLGIPELKEKLLTFPKSKGMLQNTVDKICSSYVLCFLNAFYRSQIRNMSLPVSDIMASMRLCGSVTTSIDCTQYLAHVCGHCSDAGDSVRVLDVPLSGEVRWCGSWSQNLQVKMREITKRCSLRPIPACPGFYYYYYYQEAESPFSPAEDTLSDTNAEQVDGTDDVKPKRHDTMRSSISEISSPECSNIRGLFDDLDEELPASHVAMDSLDPPLFVHFKCSVHKFEGNNDKEEKAAYSDNCEALPTCIGSFLKSSQLELSSGSSAQARLHLNCLYPPPLHVSSDGKEETVELGELPAKQRHSMLSLQNQIKWILEDEALCIPLLYKNLTLETVRRVVAHTSESVGNENCYHEQLPISFVFGVNRCLERFNVELSNISVDHCILSVVGEREYFVLTLEKESFFRRPPNVVKKIPTKIQSHRRSHSCSGASNIFVPSLGLAKQLETSISSHASAGDLIEEGVEAGYGNIWLVLRVLIQRSHQYVQLYFQRRSCFDWPKKAIEFHKNVYESVKKAVIQANRRVNQWYLLKELLDTRTCHSLLIPESESEAWVEGTLGGGEDSSSQLSRDYGCACVWSHQFKPYWRLTLAQAKNMARSGLDAFAVNDREDVFVVSEMDSNEKDEDIFYMRIFESMCGEDQSYTDGDYDLPGPLDERDTVLSTMDSISTVSVLTGREEHSFPLATDTLSDISRPTLVECLNVALYGIKQPSTKLTDNFKNIIQKKLDESALRILCSEYSKGANIKLKPQDVAFIQPKHRSPDHQVVLCIPQLLESYAQALAVYFMQLLGTFTIKPQYAPETSHFAGFADDAVALYLRPTYQGRGLGLLAVSLVDESSTVVPFNPGMTAPAHSDSWTVDDMNRIVASDPTKSTFAFNISVWEHGNISLSDVEAKMITTFHTAVMTCFFEVFLLPCPLSSYQPEDLLSPLTSPRTPLLPIPELESSLDFVQVGEKGGESSFPIRSRNDTVTIMEGVADALKDEDIPPAEPLQVIQKTWKEIELEKRRQQQRLEKQQLTESGKGGQLTETYGQHVVEMLKALWSASCPGVHQWSAKLPSQSDMVSFLASSEALMKETCWEFCTRVYAYDSDQDCYKHVDRPEDDSGGGCIIFGYCLRQWQEARQASHLETVNNTLWVDPRTKRPCQLFPPLDSHKISPHQNVPFQNIAATKNVLVPRQRLIYLNANAQQVDVYAYNLTEEIWQNFQRNLDSILNWLNLRHGLLQHIVLQKMGLFYHTEAEDMEPWTSKVVEDFTHYSSLSSLIKHGAPPKSKYGGLSKRSTGEEQRDFVAIIEQVYRDAIVQAPVMAHHNPVLRHGQQFTSVTMNWAKADNRRKTLEKAFNEWNVKKSDLSAPMSGKALAAVKDLSRIVHFCTTPILEPDLATFSFSESFRKDFKKNYIQYLEVCLHFSHISESKMVAKSDLQKHKPISFQRALHTGGILLVEVTCMPCVFTVQLFSIERSRAVVFTNRKEALLASSQFTEECSQIKDMIHVHSFSYDQHIRFLHRIFTGEFPSPKDLDAISFLYSFYMKNKIPLKYSRTRLLYDVVAITDAEQSSQLFQHVLTHPIFFGMRTLDLFDGAGETLQLCLHCQLGSDILSTKTAGEVLKDFSIDSILVQYKDQIHHFIFVVHKTESFPSETVSDVTKDYYAPDSASGRAVRSLYEGVNKHIHDTLSSAKVHIQREELWKKLLYGPERGLQQFVDLKETVTHEEMEQLLSIVQVVPLTEFDAQLTPLLNQRVKWFEVVASLLATKYQDDIRTCGNPDKGSSYTVIINPQWSDMLIVLQINSKDKQQSVNVVYRKPTGVLPGETHPHIESEQSHIHSFVNFLSSFIWANLVIHSKS